MFKKIKSIFSHKNEWFIYPSKNTSAPDLRYHYQGTKQIFHKKDCLDLACYVLNSQIQEYIKENKLK